MDTLYVLLKKKATVRFKFQNDSSISSTFLIGTTMSDFARGFIANPLIPRALAFSCEMRLLNPVQRIIGIPGLIFKICCARSLPVNPGLV